jgi:hypothetical protein
MSNIKVSEIIEVPRDFVLKDNLRKLLKKWLLNLRKKTRCFMFSQISEKWINFIDQGTGLKELEIENKIF